MKLFNLAYFDTFQRGGGDLNIERERSLCQPLPIP